MRRQVIKRSIIETSVLAISNQANAVISNVGSQVAPMGFTYDDCTGQYEIEYAVAFADAVGAQRLTG